MQQIKRPKVNILIILSTKADASSVPGPELESQSGGPGPRGQRLTQERQCNAKGWQTLQANVQEKDQP